MGWRRTGSRASCARRGRSPPRRRPCTASPTRTSPALSRSSALTGQLLHLLDGAVFVAHNASFDLGMLRHAFAREGITYEPAAVSCTLEAFRLLDPLADNHRLQSICDRRGIELHDAHEAMSDVLATTALLRVLLDEGIAPETVELDHSAYMRLRSRGDTRPASEPQIRRVFGIARSAGLVGLDGSADREQVAAARRAGHGHGRCRFAHAGAGAGRLRRARGVDRGRGGHGGGSVRVGATVRNAGLRARRRRDPRPRSRTSCRRRAPLPSAGR